MIYEAQLQACELDESLASLQRIDIFISQLRRDITKTAELNESAVLADERYRNLLLFLAFYAGRVLAGQWQHMPQWYGPLELGKHYPDLTINDDFYQHMVVAYKAATTHDELFFALEPIGMRLFGNIDRQFIALQGGQVASGLYQAVSKRLPTAKRLDNKNSIDDSIDDSSVVKAIEPIITTSAVKESFVEELIVKGPIVIKQAIIKPDIVAADIIASTTTIIEPEIKEIATVQPKIINSKRLAPTPELFTQLLAELDTIEVAQSAGNDDYRQACKVLDQFERHIAKQQKVRDEVRFSENHQAARQQALIRLKKSATAGNTAAMLRLGMYELLGEGLVTDRVSSEAAGAELVKQAANASDSRAQRLLSRMYYQGLGVAQDMDNGKIWLEQAAKNGHEEAASVVAQWQQAQMLMTSQKQEQHSIKRYQLLIAVVVVIALLLIIFVK